MRRLPRASRFAAVVVAGCAAYLGPLASANAAPPTAAWTDNDLLVPLHPVSGGGATTAIGFDRAGAVVTAYDQDGNAVWQHTVDMQGLVTEPVLSGGFDFDGDGWPDAEVALTQDSQLPDCGGQAMRRTKLVFLRGRTGAPVEATDWMEDDCAPHPADDPIRQWTANAPMFGLGTSTVALQPQYFHTGWLRGWNGSALYTQNAYYTPLEHWYEDVYTEATPHTDRTQPPNGLIARGRGVTPRLIYWTSGRLVQYSLASSPFLPFPGQLVEERLFNPAAGQPQDIQNWVAKRLYGLVTVDLPSDNVGFLAGTPTWTVFQDMLDGGPPHTLPLGGIERWAGVYNPVQDTGPFHKWWGTVYEHDYLRTNGVCPPFPPPPNVPADACYERRLAYPANPWVRTGTGPSRLAYNVYRGGHWYIHITERGTAATDLMALPDAFLWDIRDVDGDNVEDWLISPTRYPGEPGSGYYNTKWVTYLQHWNEATKTLTAHEGVNGIPYLKAAGRTPTHTTSDGALYPALSVEQDGQRRLAILTSDKQLELVDVDPP